MAKVTITFEDTDDERVRVTADFEPEVLADAPLTPAQVSAMQSLTREVSEADNSDLDYADTDIFEPRDWKGGPL